MNLWLRGLGWFGCYVVVALLPLGAVLWSSPSGSSRPPVVEVSVALGFMAFAVTLLQFALVSRLRASSRPFGTDALIQFHQQMGLVAIALVFAHPLLLAAHGVGVAAWNPFSGPLPTRAGAAAAWLLGIIGVTSVFRRRLRLSYEAWQWIHLAMALVVLWAVVVHILAARHDAAFAVTRGVVGAYAGVFLAIALRYRLVRPLLMSRRPWTVEENRDIGGSTRLVRVRPVGHRGFAFEPGQFAWLVTGRAPLWSQQHPLSIACSAERPSDAALEFSIKALGDWSGRTVPSLTPGTRVWIDGPFGAFTIDRPAAAQGFVLIAGGIGIAPLRSMLLTMRDRGDRREVRLVYAAHDPSRALFRAELDRLQQDLNLQAIYVFEDPPPDWQGERGQITADLLRRHLPGQFLRFQYFVCGPVPMMNAIESALTALGVPSGSVNTERFNMN